MKGRVKKPFLLLGRKPILSHTLSQLQKSRNINKIILVMDKNDLNKGRALVKKFKLNKVKKVVAGGRTRFESVRNGLGSLDNGSDLVFVHDAVRPFLGCSIIAKTVKAASKFGAAVAAVPATSTIKSAKDKFMVNSTLDRDKIWVVGTPQVFKRSLILEAYKNKPSSSKKVFDDSSLVERLGAKVKIVPDSYNNIKITTPSDLTAGEAILKHGGRL